MAQWVRIGKVPEMPAEGMAKAFELRGTTICVARVGGRFAALDDVCPHQGASLSEGTIEAGRIVCPWHGWSFDPNTGAELCNPLGCATVYPLRVDGDDVLCEV
jgi:nitrite reductase (NADH) small subunit